MAITLKEVAERAGVSRSAVSRTFTKGASVSDKTRRKVEKAAKQLGYTPNFLARSLSTRRTELIGLVSDNFSNPLFLHIFNLLTRGLQERDLRPLLVNLSGEAEPEESVRLLKQYAVDGVIVASSTLPPAFALRFKEAGIPVIHTFGRYTSAPQTHIVSVDNRVCGRMAAEHLIQLGYRHIGFMGGPESATSTQDRYAGFVGAMNEHPDIQFTHSFAKAYTFAAGREEMLRLIQAGPAQAYFCGDDVTAIGAMSAIQTSGMKCPDDIGIMGMNDMEIAGWENINLTTIRQPIEQIISSSLELVAAILEDPAREPETRLFRCDIVERDTLKPA